ncbi:MAG TPA: ThuA domain-containing protein [Tepidisphaeraceae bacterium]|nr:ThuA domain-containing protein [Tepidisphaeraceae bacterium]
MRNIFRGLFFAMLGLCLAAPAWAADTTPQPQQPGLAANADLAGRKKIVFLSGHPSHGFAQHEQYAGCMLLAKDLNENVPQVYAQVYKHEWPKDPHAFDGAAAIVIFCDGGEQHMAIPHLKQLDKLMNKGVGLGCIHYAVEVPRDSEAARDFLKWIGGYFETFYSVNPVWTGNFRQIPAEEVTRGVKPFTTHDEWYYHMRFRDNMEGIKPVLSAVPPDSTRQGGDDAHGGNPFVRADIGKNVAETTVWISRRANNGRGFGCTGAHYHFNWANDSFRKAILNSVLWIAHVEVPEGGVKSKTPTADELLENLDPKTPDKGFSKEKLEKQIEQMNGK